MKQRSSSQRISPTAYFTGHVWLRNHESHPAFKTIQGYCLYWLIRLSRLTPWLEDWLLARHRLIDQRLAAAIDRGEVTQVIEIASGLSPRGWRFRQRYGDRITYVETDLPSMAARKRDRLQQLGGETAHHFVRELDVLAEDGPLSLEAVAATLDHSRGTALISEGLLLYFEKSVMQRLWRRIAALLERFPHGRYLADLSPLGWPRTTSLYLFGGILSSLVQGNVHLHYSTEAQLADDLDSCGLTGDVVDPSRLSETLHVDPAAARHGRIIDVLPRP